MLQTNSTTADLALSDAEIWSIVQAKDRGSYKKYNVVFRHFLSGMSLSEYVKKAAEPGFTESLKSRNTSSGKGAR